MIDMLFIKYQHFVKINMRSWIYLNSISLLLKAGYSLLQGAVGSVVLFQCRPKLLLQLMALSCHLTHLNLNTQRHRHMQLPYNYWFVKLEDGTESGDCITLEVSSC